MTVNTNGLIGIIVLFIITINITRKLPHLCV